MVHVDPKTLKNFKFRVPLNLSGEWLMRWTMVAMCLIAWAFYWAKFAVLAGNEWGLIALSFGIFVVGPALLEALIWLRSMAAFPVLILQIFLAIMFLNSVAFASLDSVLEYVLAAVVVLTGSGNGTYLFRREFAQHYLREGRLQRKDVRQQVDALVRVKLENVQRNSLQGASAEPKHICVVVRDFSRVGLGIYGFPDDVAVLIDSLKRSEVPQLQVIYREKLYVLEIDLRWSKESPSKGECGLQIKPSSAFFSLQNVLASDAGVSPTQGLSDFANQHRMRILSVSLWLFSLASMILVARA